MAEHFETVKHLTPMLSISTETDYSEQGAYKFDAMIRKEMKFPEGGAPVSYMTEVKFDGLAINLLYHHGQLVSAGLRGDGLEGEDVTKNARCIPSIPLQLKPGLLELPDVVEVRGEVLMTRHAFRALNEQQRILQKKEFVNPRNAAAGSLRQQDPEVTRSRELVFFAYGLGHYDGKYRIPLPETQQTFLDQDYILTELENWGFQASPLASIARGPEDLIRFYKEIEEKRSLLDYEIDGVVYKVNNGSARWQLGVVGREPKWAVAHKFPAERKTTELLNIEIQVGRTGKLTPVARLKPVFVGGVVVQNATLSNEEEINRKRLYIGARVLIQRAGDVVPEVVALESSYLPENYERFNLFDYVDGKCPVCASPIAKDPEDVDWRCTGGLRCKAQLTQGILHFGSKRAMNIDDLGDVVVQCLVDNGQLTSVADIYKLKPGTISELPRYGAKSEESLLRNIERSKNTTLPRFLYGLGIRHVGEQTAKDLAAHFGSLERLATATEQQLLQVRDVGPVVVESLLKFFSTPENVAMIHELHALGVNWPPIQASASKQIWAGKTVVITGGFPVSRVDLQELLEREGARVVSSVSKTTSFVLAGTDAGSKLTKAQALSIPVLSYEEFTEELHTHYADHDDEALTKPSIPPEHYQSWLDYMTWLQAAFHYYHRDGGVEVLMSDQEWDEQSRKFYEQRDKLPAALFPVLHDPRFTGGSLYWLKPEDYPPQAFL